MLLILIFYIRLRCLLSVDRKKISSDFHGQPVSDLDFYVVKGPFSSIKSVIFKTVLLKNTAIDFFHSLCEESIKPVC